ncbi:MAG TPA: c-type cytochrome [Gammaproteobacteria bacterium]|nr:c-type cytochrome [Gammaproteobacteria bacterium]
MTRRLRNSLWLGCWIAAKALAAGPADYPEFGRAELAQGRVLWLENCEGCHGYGIAGAPVPMWPRDRESRLTQPRNTLYAHAINGFFGPGDTMMPARGGNDELTDEQVRAAVDYMVELAGFYLQQRR